MNVRMLLRQKGDTVWTIGPDETVFRALELLHEKNIGALLVLEGDKLVGILSERDYARKGILTGRMSKDTRVRDMMTTKVACVSPERTVEECMALMTHGHYRHLPVVDGDRVTGVVSIGDVVKSMIAERDFEIGHLVNYIHGEY